MLMEIRCKACRFAKPGAHPIPGSSLLVHRSPIKHTNYDFRASWNMGLWTC